MNTHKELTLMVCCHNHGDFMLSAMGHVFDQTLNPYRWKLLMIFDECTDRSLDKFYEAWSFLCVAHQKEQDWLEYQVVIRDKKEGLAACKNYGLKYCNTEFITFLDMDDGMLAERLELQLDFMHRNKNVDICSTGMFIKKKGDKRLLLGNHNSDSYQMHEDIVSRLPKENIICGASVIMCVDMLNEMGGYPMDDDYKGMEDWGLWIKCALAGKQFYKIPERLYIWNLNTSTKR